jgi:tRNA(adenine34) deaminase
MVTEEAQDEHYMREALRQAERAFEQGEVPIGCVVVCQNRIIAKGYNQTETLSDATAHAEMIGMTSASNALNSKVLDECTVYVTIEPCVMCAGALAWSRIGTLVYGAPEPKSGYTRITENLLHPKTKVRSGVLEYECKEIMVRFFQQKR